MIATKGNQPLRVRDVADVTILHRDRTQSVGFQGKKAVVLTVFRRLGGNTVNISHDVRNLPFTADPAQRSGHDGLRPGPFHQQPQWTTSATPSWSVGCSVFSILLASCAAGGPRSSPPWPHPITLAITFLFL